MDNYKETAKKLGIKYRIGKYGISLFPKMPDGKVYKLFQIIPLEGWIFDPHEIAEAIANDPVFGLKVDNNNK